MTCHPISYNNSSMDCSVEGGLTIATARAIDGGAIDWVGDVDAIGCRELLIVNLHLKFDALFTACL